MPQIFIHNKSGHPQPFEVHGWNHNLDITVKAHSTSTLHALDKSSGAIIALHNGHEGEQAEITFDGFGGNDFIDISNIIGAGGNLTIQQQGDPSTRKGDPLFMQHLRTAWHKASPQTKDELKGSVFTDEKGDVERIGPIKDHPKLEHFIRSFADGKTYIGIGSWGGSPGNANDNAQSSAAHGTKDLVITYSDEDATPDEQPPHTAHRLPVGRVKMVEHISASSPHDKPEQQQQQHLHPSGPGIDLHNRSKEPCTYFFYNNYWNGNGTAGANFDHPLKSIHLGPHESTFVDLPASFKGRVQRGTLLPATWVEFQLEASDDHAAHGDVSLEQGCDGAATIASTEAGGVVGGFEKDIITHAPEKALVRRKDGVRCLASTVGNWMAGPNEAAVEWEEKEVGQKKAYITGGTGTEDVRGEHRKLEVVFY